MVAARIPMAMAFALALLAPAALPAQRGAIDGAVRAAPTDVPLPYAIISIPALGLERFSGANGRYVMTDVPAGTHELQVRRIGFVPQRVRVQVTAGATTTLDLRLVQIPVRLTQLTVRPTEPCRTPGLPDAAKAPEIAMLVGLLRENAATYRTLVTQHPFAYAQYRALGELRGDSATLTSISTERIVGKREPTYRPGRVVVTQTVGTSRQSTLLLPTLLDLTDRRFIENHCFHYRGTSRHDEETWVRLDVRAADRLNSPDVHAAFYLDSATAQLRRMELEMSRPDRLPRHLRGIRAVHAVTVFLEIAPGLSIADDVCGVNWIAPSRGAANPAHPLELQRVAMVSFESPPPDVPFTRQFPAPPWETQLRIPRASFSCADLP